jgi:NAD-dependent dihydropyrimidine dehydrogenase PreA subunit
MIQASALNSLQFEPELCTGCGTCVDVCPHAVFVMNGHAARLSEPDDCMECGACQVNCPVGAIVVDSGVGCASAMIMAALKGEKEATCSCG